jgi:hypothetical protein
MSEQFGANFDEQFNEMVRSDIQKYSDDEQSA